jgi:hypothetical protein
MSLRYIYDCDLCNFVDIEDGVGGFGVIDATWGGGFKKLELVPLSGETFWHVCFHCVNNPDWKDKLRKRLEAGEI